MGNTTEKQKPKIQDVDASLRYGKIYSERKWNVIAAVLFFLSVLIMAFALSGLCYPPYDKSKVFIIAGSVFGFLLFIFTLFLFLYAYRGRKKAQLWLRDAVLLEAKSFSVYTKLTSRSALVSAKAASLRVTFCYNGAPRMQESRKRGKIYALPVFKKYADKKITIAYSPKFDQVMLLK